MSIFSWNRLQNTFEPNNQQPSWADAITSGLRKYSGYDQDQASTAPPIRQAPPAPTRQQLPPRDISGIDDIVSGESRGPYQNPYPGIYGLGPGLNEPRPELEKYKTMLDEYPDRPSPSWMRVLGTGALSYANAQQPDQITDTIGTNGKIQRTIKHGIFDPMNIEEAHKVLNMPYEQELTDYQNKLKARATGAALERQTLTDKSLAAQRESTALKNVAGIGQTQEKIDISADRARIAAYSAETRARLAQIAEDTKDMTDSQKAQYAAQNRINLQIMQDAEAYRRVQAQQAGANARTAAQQAGANQRTAAQQAGATERTGMQQAGANARQADKQQIGQLATQQIAQAKLDFNAAAQANPAWREYFYLDENGVPQIQEPSWKPGHPDQETYNEITQYLSNLKRQRIRPSTGGTKPSAAQKVAPSPQAKPQGANQPAPRPGYVAVEDLNGNFVAYVKADDNLKNLNTAKYRVRQ